MRVRGGRENRSCAALQWVKERLLGGLTFLGGRRLGHLLGKVGREGVKSVLVDTMLSTVIPLRFESSPFYPTSPQVEWGCGGLA